MARLNSEIIENFAQGFSAFDGAANSRPETTSSCEAHIHEAFNLGAQLPANDQGTPSITIALG